MPKSGTLATSSGYVMEGYPGTRKPSYLPPKEVRAGAAAGGSAALQLQCMSCLRVQLPAGLALTCVCSWPLPLQKRALLAEAREKALAGK